MIKELITDFRKGIADIIRPKEVKPENFIATAFNPYDAVAGKMLPSDFVKQVASNESWVYACVMAIAETCAMQKLQLYLKRGDKTENITEHVFNDLMTAVNPFMNNFELRELTEIYQLLCGNAYWYLVKNALGVPEEIWIVPGQYMKVVPDRNNFIKGYIYQSERVEPLAFDADEIVHFKYPNPNNVFYGMSPLLAAAYAVDADEYMNQYTVNAFKNFGMPAAVLSSDQIINESDSKRMREQWKQLYGGSQKAGKVAILSKGLKFEPIQMTAQEMAYISSKNINRDTILGIFRVPKSILGLVEDVNRANAEATEYIFNLHTIKPKLIRNAEKINEKIMPLYKQGAGYLYVEYSDVVPANQELESKLMSARLTAGYSTINEEREANGQEPVEWGDVPIMPFNMAPLGSAPAPTTTTPPPETTEEAMKPKKEEKYFTKERVWHIFKDRFEQETNKMTAIMKKLFIAQEKEVLKNLNKLGKSISDDIDSILFEVDEWEKEFEDEMAPEFRKTYAAGVKHGGEIARIDFDFNMMNPKTLRWLKEKTHKFSFETNDTTINQLKDELRAGLEAGESTIDLAKRVNKVFEFGSKYRSVRIARTEVADCENKGIFDMWNESGQVDKKEWLHGGGGDQPRPHHVAMSGEVRNMDEEFSNNLMWPGDQSEGPGEVCNCTCTMLPVTK
jgi:HK97 family phage portal protein